MNKYSTDERTSKQLHLCHNIYCAVQILTIVYILSILHKIFTSAFLSKLQIRMNTTNLMNFSLSHGFRNFIKIYSILFSVIWLKCIKMFIYTKKIIRIEIKFTNEKLCTFELPFQFSDYLIRGFLLEMKRVFQKEKNLR